jgi:hypothetical protein
MTGLDPAKRVDTAYSVFRKLEKPEIEDKKHEKKGGNEKTGM